MMSTAGISYEELEKKLEIQETLVECMQTVFSSRDDFAISITNLLSILAGFYSSERVYVFGFNKETQILHAKYEWYMDGLDSRLDRYSELKLNVSKSWFEEIAEAGEIYVNIDDVVTTKEEANILDDNDIKSYIAVPIRDESDVTGFIIVLNPLDNTDSFLLLQSVSSFLLKDLNESGTFDQRILKAIASVNISMHLVNIPENTFREIKSNKIINSLLVDKDYFRTPQASAQIRNVMRKLSVPHSLNDIIEFVNFSTLPQRISGKNIISHEFQGNINGWCRASFIPVHYDSEGNLKYVIFSVQQIDEEKRKEIEYQTALKTALENQSEVYGEMLQAQSTGIFAFKKESKEILMMNSAALNLFGWDAIVSANENINNILGKIESEQKEEIIEHILTLNHGDKEFKYEFSLHPNGMQENELWVLGSSKVVVLANGEDIIINSYTNITEKKKLERELYYMSMIDGMTKINNRASGEKRIESLLLDKDYGMFCLFDVDNFKHINDHYGHSVGDEVLVEIAARMKHSFRGNDIVLRLGGDEFAIYAVTVKEEKLGSMCIERFLNQLAGIEIPEIKGHKISVSMGVVFSDAEINTFEDLYHKADQLLYECKKIPGNQYSFYRK